MPKHTIKLGGHEVDETSSPYFVAEIGINHNGDLQIAKRLIDASFACGWDCVKFQKRTPDIAVPEAQKNVMRETPWGEMTYLEYKKRIEFEKEEYDYIDTYCREKPISWTASPWDEPSLTFLLNYDVPFIKLASAANMDEGLIKAAGESGKPIIMSTGMTTFEELDKSVELLDKYCDGNFILLHTNSSYPAELNELNMRMIPTLRERYHCLVGYSGHEMGLEPTVIAAAMGACVIERHVTLSHEMWGTDQKASLTIHAMDMLKRRVDEATMIMGGTEKTISESEMTVRKKLRGY